MKKMESKFICSILSLLTICIACKDGPSPATPKQPIVPVVGISTPPSTYTKKVLLEYHTAAWCGSCPDAEVKLGQVMSTVPGKIVAVAVHQSDAMQIPLFMTLDATFTSNPAYGMVSRFPSLNNVLLNRTQWLSNASNNAGSQASCGMAINSTISGTAATVQVQASFKQALSGNYNLTVYLVENDVIGTGSQYDQVNAYDNDQTSPYYHRGNPIVGYKHPNVVRKVLTANLGDAIDPAMLVAGGLIKKDFVVNLTGMISDNLYVIAFVNKIGTSSTTHEVMNVQKAKLGTLKNWD